MPEAKKNRDWPSLLLGLAVSLICLVVLARLINLQKLFDSLRYADARFLLLAFLISPGWLMVRGVAWRTLLQNEPTYGQVFTTLCEGYLLNNVLPFRLGEIGRAFLLDKKSKLGFWRVLSTIVVERLLDVIFAVALVLVSLPFVINTSWAKNSALIAGGVVLIGLVLLFVLARSRERAEQLFDKAGQRWPIILRLGKKQVSSFLNGLGALKNPALFLRSVLWFAGNWLVAIVQTLVIMKAFFPEAQPIWVIFTLGVASLGVAAPSLPGGVLVYEAIVMGALAFFTKDASRSAAFAIFNHFLNYFFTGILGGIALFKDGETLSSLYRKTRSMRAQPGDETSD